MTALRIDSLSKRYGPAIGVRDVSLRVESGQIYGLLGPNGSGKTTTLSCALGLQRPDSGQISILGQPPGKLHRSRGRVGVVFDDPALLGGLSCLQNLVYAQKLLGHSGGCAPLEALQRVGLAERAGARAASLSLGQKRRLSIARALLGKPELLVLDEPLSGLDTSGVRLVLELVLQLRDEGLTLLLSSHRLHELERVVTHIGILMGGRLVREDALSELLGRDAPRLVIRSSTPEQTRRTLEDLRPGALGDGDTSGEYFFDPGDLSAADVNERLVNAGCRISALSQERRTLQGVFEELLDEQLAPGGR